MQRKSKTFVKGVMRTYRKVKKVKTTNPIGEELAGVTTNALPPHIEYDDMAEDSSDDRAHWKKSAWEDVAVGDFVKILDNESLPADILICATSEDENVAFVETKNLDGETNLKSRNAVPALTHLRSAADCASEHNTFRLDCDRPDTNMYKLNAAVRVGEELFPVDMQMMLLRGTVVRNTRWVIGVVMYTGEDTRIVMNSGGTPSKRSKVERQMNPQVYVLFFSWSLGQETNVAQVYQFGSSGDYGSCLRNFGLSIRTPRLSKRRALAVRREHSRQ